MTEDRELLSLKTRLSPLLLRLSGVSGVGTAGRKLTVYLADDSEQLRNDVEGIIQREAPGVEVSTIVTGELRAQ